MNDLKGRIACGKNKVFGVAEEGKILVTGVPEGTVTPISHWEDIAAISVGGQVVGLKKDGTVIVSGDNRDGQGDTDSWTDIIAVAAGSWHTVGLKADGTVVAVGGNREGQCNVESWTDIIAIAVLVVQVDIVHLGGNPQIFISIIIAVGEHLCSGLQDDAHFGAVGTEGPLLCVCQMGGQIGGVLGCGE